MHFPSYQHEEVLGWATSPTPVKLDYSSMWEAKAEGTPQVGKDSREMTTRAQPRGGGHCLPCYFTLLWLLWFLTHLISVEISMAFPICIRCFVPKGYFCFCGVFTLFTETLTCACVVNCIAEDLWDMMFMQSMAVTSQNTLAIVI